MLSLKWKRGIRQLYSPTEGTVGRSGALSARGASSNGSGAMYHQIKNPIIANKANVSSASTSDSSSRKLLIRDASSF